jgi:hypothetical protein
VPNEWLKEISQDGDTRCNDKMQKIELKNAAEVAVVERRESMNRLAADRLVTVHGVEFSTAIKLDNWKKVKYARELNERGRICQKNDKWLVWKSVRGDWGVFRTFFLNHHKIPNLEPISKNKKTFYS